MLKENKDQKKVFNWFWVWVSGESYNFAFHHLLFTIAGEILVVRGNCILEEGRNEFLEAQDFEHPCYTNEVCQSALNLTWTLSFLM